MRLPLLDSLVGPHGIDGYLEQLHPLLVTGECRAEATVVERAADSVTLTLRPNRLWKGFRAGQFVEVSVEIDGVRHSRCYSPVCAEGRESPLEITVKRHPQGLVSNFLADHAKVGTIVGLSQASGDFQLPSPRPGSVLLIGAGSGITPLMAILRTLLAEEHQGPIALLQYAPDRERAIHRAELERLAAEHPNFRLRRSYTQAPGAGEMDGRFTPAHLPRESPCFATAETFACGPPGLLDAVRGTWANGLESQLHVESFVLPALLAPAGLGEGSIRFDRSGLETSNNGASLLEQAEQAGLKPRFGCRMGICHTCTCRKRAGAIKNLITGEVSCAPDEEIQLCVSAPLGDLVLDL